MENNRVNQTLNIKTNEIDCRNLAPQARGTTVQPDNASEFRVFRVGIAVQSQSVLITHKIGVGTAGVEQGVATGCQAEDSQAPTLVVCLGETAACQDKNVLVVGTAEQEIEQGVATSGQDAASTIATQSVPIGEDENCQVSNVSLIDKLQYPRYVGGGLANKTTTMGTMLGATKLSKGVATIFDTSERQVVQTNNVPDNELENGFGTAPLTQKVTGDLADKEMEHGLGTAPLTQKVTGDLLAQPDKKCRNCQRDLYYQIMLEPRGTASILDTGVAMTRDIVDKVSTMTINDTMSVMGQTVDNIQNYTKY